MQSVSSRIWTRVAVFISYDDNDYTTGTEIIFFVKDYDNMIWNGFKDAFYITLEIFII